MNMHWGDLWRFAVLGFAMGVVLGIEGFVADIGPSVIVVAAFVWGEILGRKRGADDLNA